MAGTFISSAPLFLLAPFFLPSRVEDTHAAGTNAFPGMGAALDALAEQLNENEVNTLIVVQNMRPDEFFTAAQQRRLAELLAIRRRVLDAGAQMEPGEEVELEALIDAELDGATRRAAAMVSELRS